MENNHVPPTSKPALYQKWERSLSTLPIWKGEALPEPKLLCLGQIELRND